MVGLALIGVSVLPGLLRNPEPPELPPDVGFLPADRTAAAAGEIPQEDPAGPDLGARRSTRGSGHRQDGDKRKDRRGRAGKGVRARKAAEKPANRGPRGSRKGPGRKCSAGHDGRKGSGRHDGRKGRDATGRSHSPAPNAAATASPAAPAGPPVSVSPSGSASAAPPPAPSSATAASAPAAAPAGGSSGSASPPGASPGTGSVSGAGSGSRPVSTGDGSQEFAPR